MNILITKSSVARHAINDITYQLAVADGLIARGTPFEVAIQAVKDPNVRSAVANFANRDAFTQTTASWRVRLLRAIVPNAPDALDTHVLRRLDNCLLAIPDPHVYRCLVHKYANAYPNLPRLGRPDDMKHMLRSPRDHELCADVGLAFLRRPERLKFIMTGISDLAEALDVPDEVASVLNQTAIYVADDLTRLSEPELLSIPGMTVDLAARCWTAIQRRITGDVSKPEWTPDPADVDVFNAATAETYGKIEYTRHRHNRMQAVLTGIDPSNHAARVARLSEKSRLEYVVTGRTDIPDEILDDNAVRDALFKQDIRVVADISEKLRSEHRLDIPGADPRQLAIIVDAIVAHETGTTEPERGGDPS